VTTAETKMVLSTIIEFFIPQAALSMVVCVSLFKLSSATIGRASWSNAWLFNDLVVLQPTEESVALIAGVGNQQQQQRRIPKTLEERMDALELSSARILPGMLTRAALRSEDNYYLWRWLDAAVIFAVTCLFGLLLRWLVGWYQVLIHQETACCNDMECWSEWSNTIMKSTSVLSFLVFIFVTSLWKVATLSSRLPATSRLRYPPSCYLAGLFLGLATLWLCYTPILLRSWNLQVQEALDELSSRWLLWLRMVFMSYHDTEREQYWREIFIHVAKLLIAGVCACIGFALADPLSVTIRAIIYQWHNLRGDPASNPFEYYKNQQQSRGGKYWRMFWRIHVRVAVCSTLILPLALLGTYLSGNSSIGTRVTLSWTFVYMMTTLCKPLLQGYLQQSLADVTTVLAQSQTPEVDRITHPFRYRMDRLIRVGGQIIVFPLLVTALLTSGHACRCGTSESLALYPIIFPSDSSHISIKTWQMSHAQTLAKGALVWSLTSSKSFTTCNDLDALQGFGEIDNVLIRNASQLLESKPTIPTTFFKGLRGLQKLARRALREPPVRMALLHDNPQPRVNSSEDKATITEVRRFVGDFADLSSAMIRHQHVTSTVIFPILDLLGFILCVLWVATYLLHVWTSWRTIGGIHSSTLFKVRRE
jgi:hypothetical protein